MTWLTGRRTAVTVFTALIAALVYASLWLGWRHGWEWLHAADMSALDVGHDVGVKHAGWVRFWQGLCAVFGPTVIRLTGVVVVVVALVQRQLRTALFLLVSVELCELVTRVAKGLAGRPRPATALIHVHGLSFPSGHALAATVGVLAFLTVLLPALGATARAVAMTVGALIVVAVGLGRIALNVHHPSDVLAGCALGYLCVLACAALVRPPGFSVPGRLGGHRPLDQEPRPGG